MVSFTGPVLLQTDPSTAFGFICAQQTGDRSFYYLAITSSGEYAIVNFTWSGGKPNTADVTFDDFLLASLE